MADTAEGLRVERQGAALWVTIDRISRRNALSTRTAKALSAVVRQASSDETVRALVLTGAGQEVFVAGGDLHEFSKLAEAPDGARRVLEMGQAAADLEACFVPVIALVAGAALGGGCELVLACDLVVAEAQATFTFRQAAMGLSTGWGGGTRLLERVGPSIAGRLLLLGEKVPALEAQRVGLVHEVVPLGEGAAMTAGLVDRIAALPRNAVGHTKRMMLEVKRSMRGEAHQREAMVFESLWGGREHQEAMRAFFRRKPTKV